jgi:hypothetical protein
VSKSVIELNANLLAHAIDVMQNAPDGRGVFYGAWQFHGDPTGLPAAFACCPVCLAVVLRSLFTLLPGFCRRGARRGAFGLGSALGLRLGLGLGLRL